MVRSCSFLLWRCSCLLLVGLGAQHVLCVMVLLGSVGTNVPAFCVVGTNVPALVPGGTVCAFYFPLTPRFRMCIFSNRICEVQRQMCPGKRYNPYRGGVGRYRYVPPSGGGRGAYEVRNFYSANLCKGESARCTAASFMWCCCVSTAEASWYNFPLCPPQQPHVGLPPGLHTSKLHSLRPPMP